MKDDAEMRDVEEQSERIALIRKVSNKIGIDLVINARIDFFLINPDKSKEEIIDEI